MTQKIQVKASISSSNSTLYRITTLKIGDINVHVKSYFHPPKSLYDSLFTIASTRLKEKPA